MVDIEKSYEVMKRMKQIKEAFHHIMETELKSVQLTAPQGMLVGMIAKHGEMRMTDIGEKMGLSTSTVSELVSRLEKTGALVRKKSETDGRVVMVALGEEFQKNSKCLFESIEKLWLDKINQATSEEVDQVIEGLKILERLLSGGTDDQTH